MTISRRRLLQALAWGGAAALTRATPARAAATPQEWQQVVAAAKKEGKVVVNTFPGDGYKRALKAFTQAYPDIKLEHTGLHSQDFAPRIMQERQASLFTWDVATIPTSTALQVLRPAGVWDPVRPAIVLPEALDDAGWEGGFERGFAAVKDRALAYGFCAVRGAGITINTDMVKDDLKGLTDLLNPRWKGKLLLPDVRTMIGSPPNRTHGSSRSSTSRVVPTTGRREAVTVWSRRHPAGRPGGRGRTADACARARPRRRSRARKPSC